jgi:hypothetical protein
MIFILRRIDLKRRNRERLRKINKNVLLMQNRIETRKERDKYLPITFDPLVAYPRITSLFSSDGPIGRCWWPWTPSSPISLLCSSCPSDKLLMRQAFTTIAVRPRWFPNRLLPPFQFTSHTRVPRSSIYSI